MTEQKTAVNKSNLSLWTLVLLIFVPTFGFNNIATNSHRSPHPHLNLQW